MNQPPSADSVLPPAPRPAVYGTDERQVRHQRLAELISDVIWTTDLNLQFTDVSPSIERFMGYTPEESLNNKLENILTPESYALARQFFARKLTPQRLAQPNPVATWTVELEHIRKDGSKVWGEVRVSLLCEEGRAAGLLGVTRDITERQRARQAEAALRLQSAALQSAANGIVIADREGKVVWINPAFTRLTGYEPQDIMGRDLRLLKSGQQPREVYQQLWQTILAGRIWQGEVTNRRKDGTLYTQDQTITPVRDDRGEISHFIAIQQDITERKRMEAEWRESRERFQHIFQHNPEAITIHAVEDNRFLDVNDGFLGLLGFAREEVLERTPAELGLFADPNDRQRLLDRLHQEVRLRNFECQFRGKNGKLFDVLMSVEPIQLDGQPRLLCIANDITRWKEQQAEMEEKLRRAQKLESVGTLAGGVAHDFNNLLTVIHGHTCLLLGNPSLPESCKASLQQVSLAAERATNLTRQLLTFSRKAPLQRRPLDLNEVAGTTTKMLRRVIGEDIALEIKCAPRLPLVMADTGMMEQVLMNLAINARDAIRARPDPAPPGRLLVSTSAVLALAPADGQSFDRPPGAYVCLTVQDNGCGIPPEIRDRVYDPFFTTKAVGQGTGLGLATVHGIVQEHRGWIDFDSHPNEGTIFRIHLPAVQGEAPREQAIHRQPVVRGGRETILLAEDEPSLRELAKEVLERYGYRVIPAGSGQEALQLWDMHGSTVDLLLTDVVMPGGVNGRQLAEQLDARKPGLKVIFSTGYSDQVEKWDFMQADGTYYLPKPYPPQELAQIVRDCLDGVRARGLG